MRKVSFLIKIGIFCFICFFTILFGLYVFAYISPKIELKNANQFMIYDDEDELVFQGSGANEWVEIDNISQYVIDAVISIEDKNFYMHKGFDYPRIAKAMFQNITSQSIIGGASTISQQYIKNMYLTFEQSWSRKIEEAFLTLRLEVHYTKDEILEGYLNTINYGNGNYGIQNASKYYFNKNAKDLTLEEAVMLAGIPKNPSNYNPASNYDGAVYRAKVVARAMLNNKKLSQEEFDNLYNEELAVYGKRDSNNLQTLMYYQDAVMNELSDITNIPTSLLSSGGLRVYTNLNIDAQTLLDNAIKEHMSGSNMQVASIVVNPNTGAIQALTGGYDYTKSQYNRATQSVRQVGSSIKPILYYAALENGLVSSSLFKSEPATFQFSNNSEYSPTNYNDKYANKDITMAAALAYSDNIYAIKTHLFLGTNALVETALRMGIKKELQSIPSLALGTDELNIIDYAKAYSTLASGGYKNELFFIRKIEDANGKVLYEHEETKDLVLNQNYTYILNELMTTTYDSAFIDYNTPTVINFANRLSRKYAIKSGSTGTDFWIVGYNPESLMLVWTGKDDSSTLDISDNTISKNIWYDTMEGLNKDKELIWYDTPPNVVGVIQDAITGEYTSNNKKSFVYYYLKGTEPYATSVNKEKE